MNPAVTQDPFILGPTKRVSAPDKKPIVHPDSPAAADPFLLGVGDNISSKKKVGGEPYGTATAPTESISESLSVSTEPTNPTSFLSKDIEESQNQWDAMINFRDIANPDPITPTLPDTPEKKEEKKRQILSEPEQLKKYRQERVAAIQNDIADLKNNKLAKYIDFSMQQAGIPTTQTSYTEGAQSILDEIAAKEKYLEEFNNNVKNVAAYAVASKEDLSEVSDAKLKQIGEKYLAVVGDRSLKDDLEVLRTMDATGASRVDAERTGENINFRLYTNGANALARYYSDVAQDSFEKAQSQLAEINRLQNKQSEAKTQSEKDAYGTAINALMQDENVKTALEAERNRMTYEDKSRNAIDQFPQVKRRAMRQQLNDAYFNLLQAKQGAADATPASLGYKIGNWLFGDEATEEDVPTLAKMVGIPEDEVRDIVKTNIKGWFGSADEAGVRVPGMLTGIAQASDETLAKAAMGTKRFFNVDNVEAKNRILSDRIQDYNLKAQKAKLFDDSGKLNFNPFSVFNTMGAGIGQTAVYAAPSMLTGGLASGLAASEKVGKLMSLATTTGSGFAGSYEDAYKEAAKYTDDEEKRRAYATKIGLVNGLSETILEPAEVAKKVGFGAKNNKDAFDAFVKMYDKKGPGAAMAEGLKEFGKVVGTENLEELIALVGETKFKESDLGVVTPPGEFINNAIETAITTTLTTLPLGIGAGMNGIRDQSGIVKQGLFEAGNEPELYQSKLKDLLDNGSINQDQYNNRVAVVNTMAQIVPTIKPTDINGNKLSYSQKSELAAQQFRILNNNRMLEDKNLVEAEKPLIEADTKDAIEKQTNILTGQPVEQMVDETPATPQEDLQNDIRNDLISKIQNIETNNATVNFMKGQPEDAISFIQEQATGMTTSRDDADVPTYNETVNMFGQDIVDQAVSILPQDQKDMIIKSWDAKGLEIPAPLMQAVRSTNTTDNENKSNQSSSQEAEQTSEESGNGIGEEGQEDVLSVRDVMDRPVTYNGKRATITQDGQTVIAKIVGENTEYELGNVNEISDADVSEFGIEQESPVSEITEDGAISVRGKPYVNPNKNPLRAIIRNKEGEAIGVKLQTPEGQTRTFRGQIGEDLAYQINLQETSKTNESRQQFEGFVAGNRDAEQEIISGEAEIAPAPATEKSNENVQRKPAERKAKSTRTKSTELPEKAAPTVEKKDKEAPESKKKKISSIEEAEEELKKIFGKVSPSISPKITSNEPKLPYYLSPNTIHSINNTPKDVLNNAKSFFNQKEDEYMKRGIDFVEKLLPLTRGVKFDKEGSLRIPHAGLFRHGDNSVLVNPAAAATAKEYHATAIHELVHAVTVGTLEKDVVLPIRLRQVVEDLRDVFKLPQSESDIMKGVQSGSIDRVYYGLSNPEELIAEVFSNEDFYNKLKNTKYKGSTSMTQIIYLILDAFERLTGVSINKKNYADAIVKIMEDRFINSKSVASPSGFKESASVASNEDLMQDFINRSKGLDENELKSLIKKYTGWSDEKIDGLFEEQPEGGGNEERKFTKQVLADKGIPKPTKAEIRKNLEYMRQTNAMSAAEAEKILNTVPVDEAYDIVVNDRDIKPAARVVLGQALIKKYNQLALDAQNEEDRNEYIQKTIDTADFVAEKLGTIPGQMIQALSLYKRLSPEAQIKRATREARQNGTKRKQKTSKQVDEVGKKLQQVNEETADEITKSKSLNEKIKQAKEKRTRSAEDKIAKARKRREELKAKYKSQKGGALYAGVGLTKEGIEYVGNLAKTYIDEGIAELSIIVDNIISDLRQASGKEPTPEVVSNVGDIISDQLNKRANAIVAENLKTLESDISKIIKEHYTVTQEQKQSLTQKFVAEAGLPQQEAAELAKEVESEFDRIATRKKRAILDQEKKRFDRIQKGLEGAKKTDKPQLGDDIIRYTNLGAFDNADLLDMIAEKLGTGALTPEQIKRIQDLADKVQKAPEGSPKNKATEDLLAYQADIKGTNWGEVTQAIWYANVLSGYSTHLKNIISTFFNGMSFAAAEAVRDPRSIPIIFMGGVKGAKRGAVEAWHTATTGETPIHIRAIDVPDVLERKEFVGGFFNPLNYLKYVGRAMKAEDVLQFQALKEMRATQLAYRDAKKKGLSNPFSAAVWKEINNTLLNTKDRFNEATQQAAAEGFSGPELKRRTLELMEQSRPIQLTEDAYGFAAKGTFNHDTEGTLGALNDLASQVLDLNIGGVKPLRFVVPFTRILTNVANNAIDFSPLGLIRGARGVRGFEKFSGRIQDKYHVMTPEERAQVISRAALGTAVMAALYVMTKLKGDDDEPILEITGGGTGDYKKDAFLKQGGWQPYSIKVGDEYISYALSPLAFSLGLLGNINDHEKYSKGADDEGLIQKTTMAVWQGSKLLSDMTWIGTSAGILGALGNDNPAALEKELTNQMANSAKSFVIPNIYSQTASEVQRIFDIPQKETRQWYDRFIQDIPIARNTLNDKINGLGDSVIRDTDILLSEKTADSVMKFMLDNKVWAAPVNKNSLIIYDWDKGEERSATPDEYYNFSKLRGQKIKESIRELMSSGVSFSAEGKPTISDDGITEYRIASSVTTKQLQSQITELSKKATKEAKAELNFQKPKN